MKATMQRQWLTAAMACGLVVAACEAALPPAPVGGGGGNDTGGNLGDAAGAGDATTDSDAAQDGASASDAAPSDTGAVDAGKPDVPVATDVVTVDAPPGSCKGGDPNACPGGFCATPESQCGGLGECKAKPADCPLVGAAIFVCGCDGKTYDSACFAAKNGVAVAHKGECKPIVPEGCSTLATVPNAGCAKGQYCQLPSGQCAGNGQCVKQPEVCTMEYAPVCGCDGKTYGNACSAAGSGQNVKAKGECGTGPACEVGSGMCGDGKACYGQPGQCKGPGKCEAKPQVCTKEYKPVCGCNGVTYGNSCTAAAAGVTVAKEGACDTKPGACKVGDPAGCMKGEYCAGPCGGAGSCKAKPDACPEYYKPVCGCDGKTYGNECDAAGNGQNVAYDGQCKPAADGCAVGMGIDLPCPNGQYCALPMGQCAGKGTCAAKPQACILLYKPVCGCDGKTYGNSCEAAGNGQNVQADGECGGGGGNLKWYMTCGDPVCKGWTPNAKIPPCTKEQAGDPCGQEGQMCDPQDPCNAKLLCTSKDPKMNPGGCPISRAKYKSDIRYLQAADVKDLHDQVLATRLATYRYTAAGAGAPRHLGFIIDDQQPGSPAVDAGRDMVELYGYLSMSVAAIQEQGKRIEALQAQVQALEQRAAAPMCQ